MIMYWTLLILSLPSDNATARTRLWRALKALGCGATVRHAPSNIREELTDFTERVRIEIIAPDELADVLVDGIVDVASTGQTGDGLVWITEVQRAVFIRKTVGPEGP